MRGSKAGCDVAKAWFRGEAITPSLRVSVMGGWPAFARMERLLMSAQIAGAQMWGGTANSSGAAFLLP